MNSVRILTHFLSFLPFLFRDVYAQEQSSRLRSSQLSIRQQQQQQQQTRRLAETQCTLLVVETAYADGTTSSSLECKLLLSNHAGSQEIVQIRNAPQWLSNALENDEIQSNSDILHIGSASLIDGEKLALGEYDELSIEHQPMQSNSRKNRLLSSNRKVLVVHVTGKDATTSSPPYGPNSLSDEIFGISGDKVNLRTQFKACSFDAFNVVPANGKSDTGVQVTNGVISIEIPEVTIQNAGRNSVFYAAKGRTETILGDLESQYDHVMFCLPPGTAENWIAFAYVNDNMSAYNDVMCHHPVIQMHEIGHNLGLAHSNGASFGKEYHDTSGLVS